jgi:HD-GYP domain-containing protein (c-di-GMP phosphodiesterase class II)
LEVFPLDSKPAEPTSFDNIGIQIINQKAIEKVTMQGTELSLLSSFDGTEVIHHKLFKDSRWAMQAEHGWEALEFLFIISGKLIWQSPKGNLVLKPGNSLAATPIKENAIFVAEEDTEFLYVCSKPVFHYYSEALKQKMNLAVSVEEKDGYTADHCSRIMQHSMMIGEKMNMSSHDLFILNYAAFFHDLGKVDIPIEILCKPGKLTEQEWEMMKKHTIFGKQILESTNIPYLKEVAQIVSQHHERFDGKGYPFGLKGNEIDIRAQIISVVDSFDAMTTDRVYQKARSKEEALAEIRRCSGSMYNPTVVEIFLSLVDRIE